MLEPPKSDKEAEKARKTSTAKKTREGLNCCIRVREEWEIFLKKLCKTMSEIELDNLCLFELETRTKDRSMVAVLCTICV